MGWNNRTNQYGTPFDDKPPLGYIAQNALDLLCNEQGRAIQWWNAKWSTTLKYSLVALQPTQFQVGFPESFNSRGLWAAISSEVIEQDNYDDDNAVITFIYLPGNPQQTGTAAANYASVIVTSYYLEMFASILQTAPIDRLVKDWPSVVSGKDDKPATVKKFLSIKKPDVKTELNANGIQSVLNMKLRINSYELEYNSYTLD